MDSAGSCATARARLEAVLETTELAQRRFDEVDAAFAAGEGEGDPRLAFWRDAHRRYFERQGTFAPDMPRYCERFRVRALLNSC